MENIFKGIDTVILRVSSVDKASEWYQEKLGFGVIWRDETLRLAVLDTGGATSLTIWYSPGAVAANPDSSPYPILGIANAQAGRDELVRRGVRVGEIISDHLTSYFRFFDPDGNMLEACQVH